MSGFSIPSLLDQLRERQIARPDLFIETGTYRGERAVQARRYFPVVHTIERNPQLWADFQSLRGTGDQKRLHSHLGDSRHVLPLLLELIRVPVVFFLDAHWGPDWGMNYGERELPLWEELRAIDTWKKVHGGSGVVVVDDVSCFGRDKPTADWLRVTEEEIGVALGAHTSWFLSPDQLVVLL